MEGVTVSQVGSPYPRMECHCILGSRTVPSVSKFSAPYTEQSNCNLNAWAGVW